MLFMVSQKPSASRQRNERGEVMRRLAAVGAISAIVFSAFSWMASEAEARVRKQCKVGHFHYGASSGERSKKLARRKAIASWAGFTAFEYGSHWARFRLAKSRDVQCDRIGAQWECRVEAIPCTRVRG